MIRLAKNLVSSALAIITSASLLAGCGGGSHANALPPAAAAPTAAPYTGPLANATFKITIPAPVTTSSTTRKAAYISAATKSVRINMTTSTRIPAPGAQFNVVTAVTNGTGNAPGAPCTGSGPWTCTVSMQVPPGSDTFTFTTYDNSTGTGNILSQQQQTLAVVVAIANSFNVTFDANANVMTVNASSGFCAGTFTVANAGNVGTVGTTPVTFNTSYTDLANKAIVAPGLPVLTVNGHTDTNGGAGYTDGTTHLNVKVTQSTQSFTLTQTAGTGNAAVAVTATPANSTGSSDGLAFSKTLNFTFQSGPAPPASFLAAIEQTGAASGKVDLFTISTGTNDTFSAYTTPTLANQSNDVDFPQDLLFDPNGDLLIANGGAGNPDFGNFACIPAGAITTGANAATVLTNNMNDPKYLALGTDSSVGLGNVPASSAVHLQEFVLNGTYTAAATTRDITQTDYPSLGVTGVVALPTTAQNPAGSYAVAITNGSTTSHVVIKHPDGTTVQLDDANVVNPRLGFDPASGQIVVASSNGIHSYLTFFTATTGAKVKQFVIEDTGCYSNGTTPYAGCPPNTASGSSNMKGDVVAASSSGFVAVGGITQSGLPEVQIYDNTVNRNQVGGPIPYDGTTTAGGATFVYGDTTIVHALRWITATKLMVSLEANGAGKQGIYIYDVSQALASPCTCFDANGTQFPNSPKQSGFHALTNIPLSVAYKP
ncbi:MAG: hypothetical protein JWM87_1060 [Candidatus Eremiobacteraeota bacterium]|nr:hypothetical protein [Candidatus Eremiobacteraeota bacterium]